MPVGTKISSAGKKNLHARHETYTIHLMLIISIESEKVPVRSFAEA
jgi:hypothetical protein